MIACVLRNLLTNAIRASGKGQAIYIDVEAFQKMVLVKIRDEGPGLSKEKQAALMKQSLQFFPGGGEIKEGYGIGLKIARRFIELHGGEFSMESITGLGTTVSFHIPI
jgi:signal transduction histidine kinase